MSEEIKEELNKEEKDETVKEETVKEETVKEEQTGGIKLSTALLIALVAIIITAMIVTVVMKQNKGNITSGDTNASGSSNEGLSTSELISPADSEDTYIPSVPTSEELNPLSEEEIKKGLGNGDLLKLTSSKGTAVYLRNYKNTEAFKASVSYDESDVDGLILRDVLSKKAEEKEPDHDAAATNDVVSINYAGKIDGTYFDGGTAKDQILTIGAGGYIPGFEDGIIGMKEGETKDINVTFPANYGSEDLAGKNAVFTITLNKIVATLSYPELTDELAVEASNGRLKNAEELRNYFREELAKQNIYNFMLEKFCIADMDEQAVMDIYFPVIDEYKRQAESVSMDLATIAMMYQGTDLKTMKDNIMNSSAQQYALMELYDAIAEDAGLTPSDDDLLKLATDNGYSDLEAFYSGTGTTEEIAKQYILMDQVLNYLLSLTK